jgi:hypothetical protein
VIACGHLDHEIRSHRFIEEQSLMHWLFYLPFCSIKQKA